jgi:hypothetical protein
MADINENLHTDQPQQGPGQSQTPPGGPSPAPAAELEPSKDAKMWAMLCHLLGIFTFFIAPLVIWLAKKDEHPFIEAHGKAALNWQLTLLIPLVGASIIVCVAPFVYPIVTVANLIFCIIGTVKANNGEPYKYPLVIPFIK